MARVLLVTVGGSPQPIITSIQKLAPDRVIFFCSSGKNGSESQVLGGGLPCELRENGQVTKKISNLPTYLKLGSRFQPDRDVVKLTNPDDAAECYRRAVETIQQLMASNKNDDIIVDYTGGTKTMSLSLGMAAIDYERDLYVTTTLRKNILSVSRGELPERVSTSSIQITRKLERLLPIFVTSSNYPAAISQLQDLLTFEVSEEARRHIRQYLECCQAFEAWDRFDHRTAFDLLEPFMRSPAIKPVLDFLKRVMHSRADIQEEFKIERLKLQYHGYEVVEDLLLNAERRAKQARYDDAVGRLYRALELLMQIHLKKRYDKTTAGMAPEELAALLPEALQHKYGSMLSSGKSRLQFGITRGYELLRDIPGDPLGALYKQYEGRLSKVLKIRNLSLFAHGFDPISQDDYQEFYETAKSFVEQAIETLAPDKIYAPRVQFPDELNGMF